LDVIEKAIRSALDKGNSDDRGYREKVYRSAFAALDRALAGNAGLSPEIAAKRRSDLQAKIAEIETEFIPAVQPVARPAQPIEPTPAQPPAMPPPAEAAPVRPAPAAPVEPAPRPSSAEPTAEAEGPVPAVELGDAPARQTPPPVPPIDAPQRPAATAGRFSGKAERVEPRMAKAPPPAEPLGQRVEPRLAETPPRADPRPQQRAESRLAEPPAEPRQQRVEPTLPGSPQPAEPQQRVEPTLAGSAPPRGAAGAERPVPESFFPDVSDFEGESRRPDEPEFAAAEISAGEGPNVSTDRRRPFAGIFIGVTLLALAGMGVWWGISTGLIKIPGAHDNSIIEEVPAQDDDYTPQPGAEEAPQKPGQADAQRGWIQVFSPGDPSTLTAPSDVKADIMNDETGNFVRILSGASGSAVAFDITKGVLEQIAGKHATFDIVARAQDGKETQFSIDCNFGELGDCGRKRYPATYEKRDFLFELQMPAKAPGSAGTIAITSDVDNSGKALDVFEIKVSVSE
jgi:hypothetical protein